MGPLSRVVHKEPAAARERAPETLLKLPLPRLFRGASACTPASFSLSHDCAGLIAPGGKAAEGRALGKARARFVGAACARGTALNPNLAGM